MVSKKKFYKVQLSLLETAIFQAVVGLHAESGRGSLGFT